VSFLLRVALPDRPGALGAVASALGGAGADILGVDVIERSAGRVVDDFVVDVPPGKLADSLVSAAASVPGVRVESIRAYAGQLDPHRELELLENLGANPAGSLHLLADGVARIFRAGWALVLGAPADGSSDIRASGGAAPELRSLAAPWWPPTPTRQLVADESWSPAEWARMDTELAVTALGDGALLVGRPALRWTTSELVRLQHLASIAATVAAAHDRD
jgi:hypothetical protein